MAVLAPAASPHCGACGPLYLRPLGFHNSGCAFSAFHFLTPVGLAVDDKNLRLRLRICLRPPRLAAQWGRAPVSRPLAFCALHSFMLLRSGFSQLCAVGLLAVVCLVFSHFDISQLCDWRSLRRLHSGFSQLCTSSSLMLLHSGFSPVCFVTSGSRVPCTRSG
jgi:hypothetical protein